MESGWAVPDTTTNRSPAENQGVPLEIWRGGRRKIPRAFGCPDHGSGVLRLACSTYNLIVLFECHLGWQQKVTLRNLRFWLFVIARGLSYSAGKSTIKLAVPERERDWWRRLWGKILRSRQFGRKGEGFLGRTRVRLFGAGRAFLHFEFHMEAAGGSARRH